MAVHGELATVDERQRLRDLYDEYAYLLDAGDYDRWLELFVDDCDYRVVARENVERGLPLSTVRCESRAMLGDRIEAIRTTQFFAPRVMRHFVSGVRPAERTADGVAVTANVLITESTAEEPSRLHLAGEYRDVVGERDGALRFVRKSCIYDSPIVLTSLVIPV